MNLKQILPKQTVQRLKSHSGSGWVTIFQLGQALSEKIGPIVEKKLLLTDTEQASDQWKQSLKQGNH